ncbi:hypothetical protein EVA_06482 [gut metagenome]|uniref:Uncharacterized protein n=1 Tax=gut metagenome TaxID=749906 RepID=J9GET0_9ZZZZ
MKSEYIFAFPFRFVQTARIAKNPRTLPNWECTGVLAIRYKPPRSNHAILTVLCRIHGIYRRFALHQIQW